MTPSTGQDMAMRVCNAVATATTEIPGKKTCTAAATGYASASGMRSKQNQSHVKDTALSAAQDEAAEAQRTIAMLLLSSTQHLYSRNYPMYACNRAERSKAGLQHASL